MMPFEPLRDDGRSGLVVYCDVDGTLIGEDNVLKKSIAKAIQWFVLQGHGFSLATGRSLTGVERILGRIPVTEPVVLCNGALVYDPVTGRRTISPLAHPNLQSVLPDLLLIPDIRLYLECSDGSLWVSDQQALHEAFVLEEKMTPVVFTQSTDIAEDVEVLKIGIKLLHASEEGRARTKDQLSDLLSTHAETTHFCFSAPTYGEVLAPHVNKWSGIRASLQTRTDVHRVICTVGDQQNDFEMILHADLGVAMGNAIGQLKEIADFTIGRVDDGAVVDLLHDLASCWETALRHTLLPNHARAARLRTRLLGHA